MYLLMGSIRKRYCAIEYCSVYSSFMIETESAPVPFPFQRTESTASLVFYLLLLRISSLLTSSVLASLTFCGVPRLSLLLVWPSVYNEEMKRAQSYWPRTDNCSNKVTQTAHLHVRVVFNNKWLHWAIVFLLVLMWFPCELTFLQVKQVHIRYQCYHGNASCSAPIDKLMLRCSFFTLPNSGNYRCQYSLPGSYM